MKAFVSIVVLLLLACVSFAQKTDKSRISVIWSADPDCHAGNTVEAKALKPRCSTVTIDSMTFYIIDAGGVSYAMTHRPVRDFLVASVQISNKADGPIDVNAKRSRLGRYRNVEEYAANVKTEYATPQSQDQLRQAQYRETEVIGERDGEIRSGLRKRDQYEVDKNRGRIMRRPGANIDEPEAPPTEAATPAHVTSSLLVPRAIFDNVLKSKTVPAGEKMAGHVVFKNGEDGEGKNYMVMYLTAGPIEFVFPTQPK